MSPPLDRSVPPWETAGERAAALFRLTYGTAPTVLTSAPGRVNLIGEHLDYNGGPVLPFAIDRRSWVAAAPADEFTMVSADVAAPPVRREAGPPHGDWTDYLMGVVRELAADGRAPAGASIAVASDIAPGAGLSSSAALAVATAAALGSMAGHRLSPGELAEVAFRAEHDYVGVRCGRMDQTVVAHAVERAALFIDTGSGARTVCPFPYAVWILPTGVSHALADGGYNARRAECERALELCRGRWPDLPGLAALGPARLAEALTLLPSPLDRRVRHVVSETARTGDARDALGRGDLVRLGQLLVAGHGSLRDDFENTVPEADLLVEAAVESGALGARLTGAGWGGSVVMLAGETEEARVLSETETTFARRFGRELAAWRTTATSGVRLESLA